MRWFFRLSVLSLTLAALVWVGPAGACYWGGDLARLPARMAPHLVSFGLRTLWGIAGDLPRIAVTVSGEVTTDSPEEESDWSDVAPTGVDSAGLTQKAGDIVRMGDPVVVDEDVVVSGDVVVMGSDATVLGTVRGDVVAIGGNIVLGEGGSIVGDAVSIGGSITKPEGAKVYGQEVSMAGIPIPFLTLGLRAAKNPFLANALGLLWCIARMLAVVLFCMLVAAVMPRPLGVIASLAREDVVKCGLVGLLIEFLSLPGLFALIISIVGIFAVPAVILLLIVAGVVGLAASALLVGRRLLPGRALTAVVAPVALGATVIQSPAFAARVIGFIPFLFPLKLVLAIVGGVAFYLAMTIGLGAVWLTRFGRRYPQPKPVQGAGTLPPAASEPSGPGAPGVAAPGDVSRPAGGEAG
jgi:hypothetical protein